MLNFNMLYIQARYARLKFIADQRDMSDTILPAKNAIDNFNQYIGFNPFKWASSFITGTKGYSLRATAHLMIRKSASELNREIVTAQEKKTNKHFLDQIDHSNDLLAAERQKNVQLTEKYNNIYAHYLQACLTINSFLKTNPSEPVPSSNTGEQTFFKRNGKDYASYAIPRKERPDTSIIVAPNNRM